MWQCDKFCGAELQINSSTLEIVRVPSTCPAATMCPHQIDHTTTTMSREALKPQKLNVNYLPPPLILSSPPSSPNNVRKKCAKHCNMANHLGPKLTSSQTPPPPTVVQHCLVNIPDVSSPPAEAPPTLLNHEDKYSCLVKTYIEPAGSTTSDHFAKSSTKTLKKSIQN